MKKVSDIALTERGAWMWTTFAFLLMSVVMAWGSVMRHQVFKSSFDFAIFAQAIRNTWSGSFLYSSIKGGICLLGDHVSPILVLFSPLFGIWDNPSVLLIAQAIAAASSVFPIYLIGKEVLKDSKLPLLFVFAFLLYLPTRNAIRFDFHPELFGDPLILWAFFFILKDRARTAFIFLMLTLTTKEIACAPVAMLGLWSWWFRKKTVFGISTFLAAVSVFLLDVRVIAPYFREGEYFYLAGNYLKWAEKGIGPFLSHVFQPSTFTYLKKVFLPLGFLSFLSASSLLLTFPILFQNLVAKKR